MSPSKQQTVLFIATIIMYSKVHSMMYRDTTAHYGSRHAHELANANCPNLCSAIILKTHVN